MLLWARGWAKPSMEFPHYLCESVIWTSDRACSTSLWKTDLNWVSFLLKMSLSSYPPCLIFHTLGRLYLCAFCFLAFLVVFLLLVREKKRSQIFKCPQEAWWNDHIWRPHVASLPVSSSLYWTLCGEDNGFSFYLPLSWCVHHVCKTLEM